MNLLTIPKIMAFVTAAGLTAGAVAWAVFSGGSHAKPDATSSRSTDDDTTRDALRDIGATVRVLSNRVALLSAEREHGNSEGIVTDAAAEDQVGHPDEDQHWAQQGPDEAMAEAEADVTTIDDAFAREARDPAWGSEMREVISEALDADDYGSTELVESDCKTTFCRVKVKHGDKDSSEAFERIVQHIPGAYYLQHLRANADGTSSTVLYLVREGHERDSIVMLAATD